MNKLTQTESEQLFGTHEQQANWKRLFSTMTDPKWEKLDVYQGGVLYTLIEDFDLEPIAQYFSIETMVSYEAYAITEMFVGIRKDHAKGEITVHGMINPFHPNTVAKSN